MRKGSVGLTPAVQKVWDVADSCEADARDPCWLEIRKEIAAYDRLRGNKVIPALMGPANSLSNACAVNQSNDFAVCSLRALQTSDCLTAFMSCMCFMHAALHVHHIRDSNVPDKACQTVRRRLQYGSVMRIMRGPLSHCNYCAIQCRLLCTAQAMPACLGCGALHGRTMVFLAFEDCGPSLLEEPLTSQLVTGIRAAIKAVHSAGILHNDLHLRNLVSQDEGTGPQVKLIDFASSVVHERCHDKMERETKQFLDTLPSQVSFTIHSKAAVLDCSSPASSV